MNFKLVSKNNIGGAAALILVILLTHGKVFNFLLDTALGRTILITFILAIAYTSKFLGAAAVLFIIILFTQSDIGYLEGFTQSSPTVAPPLSPKKEIQQIKHDKPKKPASIEGFDIIGTENNIKRGKQSNSIPVSNFMRSSTNVQPHDGDSEVYSKF